MTNAVLGSRLSVEWRKPRLRQLKLDPLGGPRMLVLWNYYLSFWDGLLCVSHSVCVTTLSWTGKARCNPRTTLIGMDWGCFG